MIKIDFDTIFFTLHFTIIFIICHHLYCCSVNIMSSLVSFDCTEFFFFSVTAPGPGPRGLSDRFITLTRMQQISSRLYVYYLLLYSLSHALLFILLFYFLFYLLDNRASFCTRQLIYLCVIYFSFVSLHFLESLHLHFPNDVAVFAYKIYIFNIFYI